MDFQVLPGWWPTSAIFDNSFVQRTAITHLMERTSTDHGLKELDVWMHDGFLGRTGTEEMAMPTDCAGPVTLIMLHT